MSTNIQDHQRYEDVIIKEVTNVDAGGWVGIVTEEHGEIRCKSNLRTKLKLKKDWEGDLTVWINPCLLYTSPSPRDRQKARMPSSA